jgi:pyridoxal phosphate enzyme (YggS family)
MTDLAHNLETLKHRVAAATAACGRDAADITILAVTKSQPVAVVESAWRAGIRDFGGNYLQEAETHIGAAPDATWHFIGRVQSNKTRRIAEAFSWVHTIDRLDIAQRLARQRPRSRPDLDVCIQVNIDDEADKGGVLPHEVAGLAHAIADLPRLRLRGLMAIPRPRDDVAAQRVAFAKVRGALEALRDDGLSVDTLSMGMTQDLEAAVMEGATILRIGTALFGPRD